MSSHLGSTCDKYVDGSLLCMLVTILILGTNSRCIIRSLRLLCLSRHGEFSNRMGKDDNCFEQVIHVWSCLVVYVIVASVIQKSEPSIFATFV
jgi:hypothetical protein